MIDSALCGGFLNCLLAGNYSAEQAGHGGTWLCVCVCVARVISSL